MIENNDVSANGGRGIRLEGSAAYNLPAQNVHILVTGRSDNNIIRNNTVRNNKGACGIVVSTDSSNNTVEGNTVSNNPAGIVISGIPPFGLPGTPFASHVPASNGNVVRGNTVSNNGAGIIIDPIVGSANGNTVSGNAVSGNGPCEPPCPAGKTVGIAVVAGATPFDQADANVVGPGDTITAEDVPGFVGGTATHTQVLDAGFTIAPPLAPPAAGPAPVAAPNTGSAGLLGPRRAGADGWTFWSFAAAVLLTAVGLGTIAGGAALGKRD